MEECNYIQYLMKHGFVCFHGEKAQGISEGSVITLEKGRAVVEVLVVQAIHEDQPGETGLYSPRPLDIAVLKLLHVVRK